MMRILSGAGLVALISAAPAFAADLPVKAPAMAAAAPVPFSWTGCYIGGHIGGVVSEDRTTNAFGSSAGFSSGGFVGGGQIGCDYQFAAGWVAGVEGRAAWSSLTYTHSGGVIFPAIGARVPAQFTLGNDFLASTTARLGYSLVDRWLVYFRGGAAWTNERGDIAFTNLQGIAVDPSATMTRTGWTAGTGVDWAFAPHWSANVEYNYYDFGNASARLTGANNAVVNVFSLKDKIHAITTGASYHF